MNMEDLVKNSLRMRPDRIMVGEVRGNEAKDLMTAMNIGKYCMGTVHASTARETVMRLENEPMNVAGVLINLIDVIVIMRRYNLEGSIHRAIGEVVETAGMEREKILFSTLFSYDRTKGDFQESAVSSVYRDRLALVSGRTPKEILEEIKVRAGILGTLLTKNITDIQEVSEICRRYIKDPQGVFKELKLNRKDLIKG